MFRLCLIALTLCLGFPAASSADTGWQAQSTLAGRWITANGQAVIQIGPCGADLCGQIVGIALAHPGDPMPADWKGQPQCGLTIIQTAPATDADGSPFWQGVVLDPRDGTVYHANLRLDADRHLLLHGYVGLPLFGQTQTWLPYVGRTLANCRMAAANLSQAGG